ncbi:TPA: M23 family metallopeptidase [Candidatus Micrarchaeota archaeon]|nr:M23 family metallopeptidase [Candidatus Micrarchaeota archaeon]
MTSPGIEQEVKLTPEQFAVFRGFLNRMITDGIIICHPITEDTASLQTRLAVRLMQEKINRLVLVDGDGNKIVMKPNGVITFETIRAFSIANSSSLLNLSQKPIPVVAIQGKAETKKKSISSPFSLAHPPIIGHKPAYNFGARREEYTTTGGEVVAAHSHRGIDISCPGGTKVYSTTSGEVVKVDKDPGGKGGNYVVIRDNAGLFHHYMHMGSMSVRTGQFVSAGTRIGDVARTGFARGSRSPIHLHYEIRSEVNSGRAINFTGALREAYRQHEQTATLQVR